MPRAVLRVACAAALPLGWACTSSPSPSVDPGATRIEPEAAEPEPEPTVDPDPEAELLRPAFLEFDFEKQGILSLAAIARVGPVYPRQSGSGFLQRESGFWFDSGDRTYRHPRIVLDEGDPRAHDRRVRLQCDSWRARVAVWHRASDLYRTNRVEARLQPRPVAVRNATRSTPGITFPAGAALEVGAVNDVGSVPVSFDDGLVDARGWMAEQFIDVVWDLVPELDDDVEFEGEDAWIRSDRPLRFHAEPDGDVFATLRRHLQGPVTALERRGEWVLIARPRHSYTLVGWVPAKRLRSKPSGNTGLIGKGGGGGRGSGYVAVEVDLAADTLLLDERSGDPLGVVRQSGPFECEALCESEQPLVWVEACGVEVRLQAQRVTVPSR